MKFKNLSKTKSLLELFILCFCFTSCIVKMFNLNVFFKIEDLEKFKKDPSAYTVYYSPRFIVLKLVFQTCVCFYLISYLKKSELENVSNFHSGIKSSNMFSFFNKLIYYIYNFELLSNSNKSAFLINFYNYLAEHRSRCRTPECDCEVIELKFKKINLTQDEITKTKAIKKFFIEIISETLKNLIKIKGRMSQLIILICCLLIFWFVYFFRSITLLAFLILKNSIRIKPLGKALLPR